MFGFRFRETLVGTTTQPICIFVPVCIPAGFVKRLKLHRDALLNKTFVQKF